MTASHKNDRVRSELEELADKALVATVTVIAVLLSALVVAMFVFAIWNTWT